MFVNAVCENDFENARTALLRMSDEQQQRPQEKACPVRGGASNGVKEVHHYHYKEKKVWFSPGKLFAGILVVLLGVFLLLSNMGLVQVNMKLSVWELWPVLLISVLTA